VLAGKFVPAQTEEKEPSSCGRSTASTPALRAALRAPERTLAIALAPSSRRRRGRLPLLGGEFMPHLEEGNFWIRATFPMSISLEQSASTSADARDPPRMPQGRGAPCDEKTARTPEVLTVVSQLGRPDDGTDVAGFQNIELFAPLARSTSGRAGDEGQADRRALEGAREGVPRRRLQLLADDQRQRRGGRLRREGRELGQGLRPDLEANEKNAQRSST
jgi:cobalt-zinc-cadmium resistance protein CzcA